MRSPVPGLGHMHAGNACRHNQTVHVCSTALISIAVLIPHLWLGTKAVGKLRSPIAEVRVVISFVCMHEELCWLPKNCECTCSLFGVLLCVSAREVLWLPLDTRHVIWANRVF